MSNTTDHVIDKMNEDGSNLSPIEKKIKEAMSELWDEFWKEENGNRTLDELKGIIAHRKANELYISDEEIDELRGGSEATDFAFSEGQRDVRDYLFEPKNEG